MPDGGSSVWRMNERVSVSNSIDPCERFSLRCEVKKRRKNGQNRKQAKNLTEESG